VTPAEIRAAIRDFLDLLEHGRGSEYENWRDLVRCLDRLCWAYHRAEERAESGPRDSYCPSTPFMERYMALRTLAGARFPDFGYYNHLDNTTTEIAEPRPYLVGDAIDDLASIAAVLQAAQWRWEHVSEGHALYMFRLEFASHALDHVRYLQVFLLEYLQEQRPEWVGTY